MGLDIRFMAVLIVLTGLYRRAQQSCEADNEMFAKGFVQRQETIKNVQI